MLHSFGDPLRTLSWQPIKVAKSAFSVEKFSLSRCHFGMDWNIGTPIGSLECGYIVYKFGDVWCGNSRETFAYFCTFVIQVALLSQRDRATCLSVEILQLQNIAIVWHYLCDPTFSRFYTIPKCDRHTHTDGRTDTRRRHVLRLA